jgi:type II secretion system protein J
MEGSAHEYFAGATNRTSRRIQNVEQRTLNFELRTEMALSRQRAFTLIELILSIAIMAIVLVAINAVLFSALRLRERTSASVEDSLPLEQSLEILRRDLQGATPPSSNGILAGSFKAGAVTSLGSSLPVAIEFNTTTGIPNDKEPWGEVQRVSYGLRPSADRTAVGQNLYRNVTRNLLALIPPQPDEQWMMSGVDRIEFSCYDGLQWRSDWDTTLMDTNLPSAVRVRILLANADRSTSPIEMVVPIESQAGSNQVSTAEELP